MRVAIIPARGGSKGIKNKNLTEFCGKPLITWVIETALESHLFKKVVVSTDSSKIRDFVSSKFPNVLIIMRPIEYATDTSVSEEAILHAILFIENKLSINLEQIVFMQATSPFTTVKDLIRLTKKLNEYESVSFYTEDFGYHFDIDDMISPRKPRQIRHPKKKEAGNAWAFDAQKFKKFKSRLFSNIGLVKINELNAFEIDEQIDIKVGEILLSIIKN